MGTTASIYRDISDMGQKGVIQDGVQDGRHVIMTSITPCGIVLK